jgi:hypothetical protein
MRRLHHIPLRVDRLHTSSITTLPCTHHPHLCPAPHPTHAHHALPLLLLLLLLVLVLVLVLVLENVRMSNTIFFVFSPPFPVRTVMTWKVPFENRPF